MQAHRLVRLCAGLAVLALVGLTAAPALAQFDRGQIAGVIKDQTGGVIPGATVTVTNTQTRLTRTVVTDGTGYYIFNALAPGAYDVDVELPGFKKWSQSGVRLDAAAKLTLDATLDTGVISEAVLVQAKSTPLAFDTQNRKTIESKDFENMALNGRNPINLAMLKAGRPQRQRDECVSRRQPDQRQLQHQRQPQRREPDHRGRRDRHADAIGRRRDRHAQRRYRAGSAGPDLELPAGYGRSSGGQIRFVTKSGGHDFHGTLYDFMRSDKLDANTWSRNASANPLLAQPAPLSMHQFGGTIGGPLVLGQFNKQRDKLFFFLGRGRRAAAHRCDR